MRQIKEQENLENIVSRITSKYNIEQIYLNTYDRDILPYELIILVSNKYVKTLGDLVPKIVNTIREYPQYKTMCYVAFQAKDKIREGNLFLFTSCQPQKLIYNKENSEFVPIPENFDYKKCKELTVALQDREQQKIDEFKAGYYHFNEKGKYALASFMLHQTVELTYRYLELLLVAKERITHSIRCHHLYLKEISSIYACVFDEDDHDDIVLLQILEDIYRSTRYEDNFEIDSATLKRLEVKMEGLHKNAEQIFSHIMDSFEQAYLENHHITDETHHLPGKITRTKMDENAYLKDAIEQLKVSLSEPFMIYLFGYRARSFFIEGMINERESTGICDYYFDLLVISETDIREQLSSLQPLINERLGISLFLLYFTQDQVQKQLDKNSLFFHRVLCGNETLLHAGLEANSWHFHENNGVRTKQESNGFLTNASSSFEEHFLMIRYND
ncbi:HEPN domain-containing protein [Sphingobacterium sp. SGG-5]|uniref:HEPN domain-containing protein n=1 Tax=Sphingobacterium sp. SGG-5 TaxID=2710881 RepID=UPI0013ED9D60|nr:HEPN domain-containing protein [Sphingobacterium sp. SGG-5]NGM61964.1 HEPN domain-containing protein [Sphingobacterium sp. SGG-5]